MTESGARVWHVYIVRCADRSLYTGVAVDVARRFAEHQAGGARCARYLRGRGPLTLAMSREAGGRGDALRLEYRIKKLRREDKERLVRDDGRLFTQLLLPA